MASIDPESRPSRRLPIPPLRQTIDKYLKSLEPFLRQDESEGGPSVEVEMSKRVRWANDFETGVGRILQERLSALDKASPYNWLDDNFWMKVAYHQSRTPLLINSNWWCIYRPDPSIPEKPLAEDNTFTFWQVRRASWLVHRMLQYRAGLEGPAARRTDPLAVPFQMPFYRCRIPMIPCDTLATLPIRGSAESKRIILMLHDWCYAVDVLDKSDAPIPVAEIEERIWNVVYDVNRRQEQNEIPVPIGILTTQDRTIWANTRNHLLEISPNNREVLSAIENSIFVLSLDGYTFRSQESSTPIKNACLDAHVRNASSGMGGHNRWYDKCVSIYVNSDAQAGGMGEHSPCDGLVVGAMMHHSLSENIDSRQFEQVGSASSSTVQKVNGWKRLDWVVDERITTECSEAETAALRIIDDSDVSMLHFTDYGARWIKDISQLSPDAYAQIAMQLAWHRSQGDFTATYETATTQMFLRGRTETIRSFSTESWQFVKAMTDPRCPSPTRRRCLQDAIRAHSASTREAVRGRGIDRHLLGLRLLMRDNEKAELFQDPLFARSETWKLSTSGLFRGEKFLGTGFGSPFWDGYGVQYILDPDILKFGVESKRSCPTTSTERFEEALVMSLRDMRILCEGNAGVEHSTRL